jgi:hypothetical protein
MSTRDFSWGKGGQCVRLTTYHPRSAERQGTPGLNLPGTPWTTSARCGRPLPLPLPFYCDSHMNALMHSVVQHRASYITVDNTHSHHWFNGLNILRNKQNTCKFHVRRKIVSSVKERVFIYDFRPNGSCYTCACGHSRMLCDSASFGRKLAEIGHFRFRLQGQCHVPENFSSFFYNVPLQ